MTSATESNGSGGGKKKDPTRKRRASKPKSRTGCLTCKQRHVKCDERKPECIRCLTIGLKCAGYESAGRQAIPKPNFSASPDSGQLLNSPTFQLPAFDYKSPQEKRALEFLYYRAAPLLSGFYYRRFWSKALFQLGLQEAAVKYAMIALSSAYENQCIYDQGEEADPDLDLNFALESYNQAIRHLLAHLHKPESNILVPLMVCIIFVVIDCIRHDVPAALNHVSGGLKLLEVWRQKQKKRVAPLIPQPHHGLIEEIIVPIFAWLNMITSIFGGTTHSVSWLSVGIQDRPPIPKPKNTDEAIAILLDIIDGFIKFMKINGRAKYDLVKSPALTAEHGRILMEMNLWKVAFDEMVNDPNYDYTETRPGAINLINAAFTAIRMWSEACFSPYETVWDGYKTQFEEILTLAGTAVGDNLRFPDAFAKSFAFEMALIPTIQFVAWKCRWPHIRRRALALLRNAPKREAIFESRYSLVLCERVMKIEESALPTLPGGMPPPDVLPSEAARVHHMDFPPLPTTRRGRPVNFLTKPLGVTEQWHVRSEYINVNSIELLRWFDVNVVSSADEHQSSLQIATQKNKKIAQMWAVQPDDDFQGGEGSVGPASEAGTLASNGSSPTKA